MFIFNQPEKFSLKVSWYEGLPAKVLTSQKGFIIIFGINTYDIFTELLSFDQFQITSLLIQIGQKKLTIFLFSLGGKWSLPNQSMAAEYGSSPLSKPVIQMSSTMKQTFISCHNSVCHHCTKILRDERMLTLVLRFSSGSPISKPTQANPCNFRLLHVKFLWISWCMLWPPIESSDRQLPLQYIH